MIYNHNYQKIKYQVTICKQSSQILGEKIEWPPKNNWVFASFSWKPGGSLKFLKDPKPVVLWIWFFFKTLNCWFYDSGKFHIPGWDWWFFDSEVFSNTQNWQVLQKSNTCPILVGTQREPSQEVCQRNEIYQHPSSILFLHKISPCGDLRKEGSCESYKGFFWKKMAKSCHNFKEKKKLSSRDLDHSF